MKLNDDIYSSLVTLVVAMINCDKNEGKTLEKEDIDGYIDKAFKTICLPYDEEDRKKLFVDLEYRFSIKHSEGSCIFNDYENLADWYSNDDVKSTFFWNRYREYLIEQGKIDTPSINLLGETTLPNILNCLSNPNEEFEGKRLRRGLIIGDVQSGKTATYTGLICKAADAGYKVVILLAGITEILRQQTQERIDEGIIGYTMFMAGNERREGNVGVGLDNKPKRATSFTSCINDFVAGSDRINTTLSEHNSVVLFVVKKNVSVLGKLYNWLKNHNLDAIHDYIDHPLLLIDDEADNASVNTKKDELDPTQTNKKIRNICNLFKNATYVGFTATPFANVFIDPDSVNDMKQADLFPEHFIYVLPTPSSYMGPDRIFYENGDHHANLHFITDIEEPEQTSSVELDAPALLDSSPFYAKHSRNWDGPLPTSLDDSILCFFMANVVRDLRGDSGAPRSMLINMSRFIKVHNVIKEHVEAVYSDFKSDVRYNFSDNDVDNYDLPLYKRMKSLWDVHFSSTHDITFSRVVQKQSLIDAVKSIQIIAVNGSKSGTKLNYKADKSLRVIAIGGLALSRGLTLEGLLVSYFYRNTSTFDVLMQMGRWFGYRYKYEDLFQIWISELSADWYREIAESSQELKDDIKTMYEQRLTPKDFGIRVRSFCEDLQITARNKMRTSYELVIPFSYYGNIFDTPYICRNVAQNTKNREAVVDFAKQLFENQYPFAFADLDRNERSNDSDMGKSRYFSDVTKLDVLDFLDKIECSLMNRTFNVSNIKDFISDEQTTGVDKWDVVFEGGDGSLHYDIPGLEDIKCVKRAIYETNNVIQIGSRRRILGTREGRFALTKNEIETVKNKRREEWQKDADNDAAKNLMDKVIPLRAYFQYLPNRKPLLIIMQIQAEPKGGNCKKLDKFTRELEGNSIMAFAVGFPGVKDAGTAKRYKVNKIYYNQNMVDDTEEMEDE